MGFFCDEEDDGEEDCKDEGEEDCKDDEDGCCEDNEDGCEDDEKGRDSPVISRSSSLLSGIIEKT